MIAHAALRLEAVRLLAAYFARLVVNRSGCLLLGEKSTQDDDFAFAVCSVLCPKMNLGLPDALLPL